MLIDLRGHTSSIALTILGWIHLVVGLAASDPEEQGIVGGNMIPKRQAVLSCSNSSLSSDLGQRKLFSSARSQSNRR